MQIALQFILFFLFFLFFIAVYPIYSQLNSDRPGYSDPPQTVGFGKLQWENGFDFTFFEGRTEINEFKPLNSLIRYGISDFSEFRLSLGYSRSQDNSEISNSGFSDLGLGMKLKIFESDNSLLPSSSLIMSLGLPYGDDNFKPDILEPSLVFVFENAINDDYSVGYNLGFNWSEGDVSSLYSLSVAYNINEKLNATLGYLSELYLNDKPKQYLEFALGYMLLNNLQIDFWTTYTPFYETKENFFGVGFSWLLN